MLKNFISIEGVANVSEFPTLTTLDRYNQFEVEEQVTIPAEKPEMEQIVSVMVEASIKNYYAIATPTGLKVIIEGELKQKITYVANEPTQSIHSAMFITGFCNFIDIPLNLPTGQNVLNILQTLGITLDDVVSAPPNIIIEDFSISQIDTRKAKKCTILFAWVRVNALLATYLPT
ncbi:DUF3794 domain-containing protein [Anaerocellum diazotrophicum]|uniref:SipL SPOCS domain-containing protein n=1 Tax=Caldicellulosiruptor diazotrophicus TaxID=2806205 RepID=A0ABM7NJU4_9FIRM|nr:DUF3794 domain-containing protein [Caldicellulosiruptor diazotrophicus]BCS80376.1 hypothetical protein CaldiYA01_03360 [Caldicellulosiruptor diazotrophicus]